MLLCGVRLDSLVLAEAANPDVGPANQNGEGSEDKILWLPEELLCHILGMLCMVEPLFDGDSVGPQCSITQLRGLCSNNI